MRQRTVAVQPTVSIGEALSDTAKISWCVRWKSSTNVATSSSLRKRLDRSRTSISQA